MKFFYIIQALLMVIYCTADVSAETASQQIASLVSTADENGVVQGKDGWLFLKEELEHLASKGFYGQDVLAVSKAAKPEFADPLPAIIDFNNQLKKRGIQLLFVPIPPKALIYPDKLPGNFDSEISLELELPYKTFYTRLSEQGIHVLDLIPIFLEARNDKQLYCKTDTHFSGTGLGLVADKLSEIVKKNAWYPGIEKKKYIQQVRDVVIHGDLAVMQKAEIKEELTLQFVTDAETGKAILPDKSSPVLLLGDSHTLVFSVGGDLHANGAGLFDQLGADLGLAVDLIGVRGSGATPSRIKLYQRSRKENSFLEKKKTIIWCLSAREFTGSGGWRKIPVAKK